MIKSIKKMVHDYTPSSGGVYESAKLNDNLDGTGGVTVSWEANENITLPVGASIIVNGVKYSLLDPYAPRRSSPLTFRYEPTFLHPLARLSRVPYYIDSRDADNNEVQLHTVDYTGLPRTIVQNLVDFFTVYGGIDTEFGSTFGAWNYDIGGLDGQSWNQLITVNFDGCSIRAAATRIADAIGCNVFFDWPTHTIRFIAGTTVGGEYYNCFRVLGGTRNMAKKTVQGLYAAVTKRLTLPEKGEHAYPGSMMYRSDNGQRPEILLTRDLIFDDIYPKMELFISSARPRYCYLTDEDGEKIVDCYKKDGQIVPAGTEGAEVVYKKYAKWYVMLRDANGNIYDHDTNIQIADKPLSILFQPDYANIGTSSPLAGRQFEVVYFAENTEEWEEDDVLPSTTPFKARVGEFRIVFTAEGEAIVPSVPEDFLVPKIGNKVTLVNVALTNENSSVDYLGIAQEELRTAALEVIALMDNDNGQYSGQVADYKGSEDRRTIGSQYTIDGHSGVITTIAADLDTGVADITIGSWSRKSLTGGVRDKIDAVTTNATSSDVENANYMSKAAFNTLWQTTKKSNKAQEIANTLGARIDEIAQQSDAQFNVIFGYGDPTTSENPPEAEWTTDELKNMHLQDIYYDQDIEAASTGGRAWRWMFHAAGTTGEDGTNYNYDTWRWEEITDMDTLLSLQKIADVAGDGVLTGGAEKTRIFIEWKSAADEFARLYAESENYALSTERSNLNTNYWALWQLLNGGEAAGSGDVYSTVPSWLQSLTTTTRIANYSIDGNVITPEMYRAAWNNFYDSYAALNTAITGKTRMLVAGKMSYYASVNIPNPPYNLGDMWMKLKSSNSNDGELYTCINAKNANESAALSDWRRVSNFGVSTANLLGTLYIALESRIKTMLSELEASEDHLNVYFTNEASTSLMTSSSIIYDASYQPSNTIPGRVYFGSSGYDYDLEYSTLKLFYEIYKILGEFSLKIWNKLEPYAEQYDLYGTRSSFTDSFTKETIEGGLSVWMHGDTTWAQILEDTTGILQNYGDHIVAAIYGVDAATAQSMSTNLTLAKNFAQLMAQAGSDSSGTMKDVAGIRVVADEHEDPNDDTSPITKGHVEVVGNFYSADKTVKIGRTAWSSDGHTSHRTGIEISDSTNEDIIIKSVYYLNSQIPESSYTPSIVLTTRRDDPGNQEFYKVFIDHGVHSEFFSVLRKVRTGYDTYEFTRIGGVGTPDQPVTFIAKDANGNDVTVTVMGGIITGVTSTSNS